ncbi:MAG: hypothetical protein SFU56_21445, partial [Capsulimonadales bacterium]|nr:hypothetical protein [Capsulimonadales bacterium]
MPLPEVIARSTHIPARIIGHPELGTLTVGTEADIAVLELREVSCGFTDCGRARMTGNQKLECFLTVRAGRVVYDPNGCTMPEWTEAPPSYGIMKGV